MDKELLSIKDLPRLPDEIIDAYENNKLVLFIGAGISRLMGCKGWDEMANTLIRKCCKDSLADQICRSSLGSKEKITIAHRISLEEKGKENVFWKTFAEAIIPKRKSDIDIYTSIAALNIPIITTNCDHLLINHFPGRYTTECTQEMYEHHMDGPYVYCIHGLYGESKEERATLVFTADQYLSRYSNKSSLREFLKLIFDTKTVLFLGCGLSEFEILSAVFQPRSKDTTSDKSHFALEGFFIYQEQYYEAIALYYDSVGIKLIPYSKEEKGYHQQIDIINNWIDELAQKSSLYSRGIDEIDKALNVFDDVSKETLKTNLSHSKERRRVFLKSVLDFLPKKTEGLKWLMFLIENNYISPTQLLDEEQEKSRYLQRSDILTSISDCLDQYKPDESEIKIIHDFIKESIRTVVLNKGLLSNFLITKELSSICIKMDMPPSDKDSWMVFSEWFQSSVDSGFKIISRYIDLIRKWDNDTLIRLFNNMFMPPKGGENNTKGYWFEHIAQLIVHKLSKSTIIIESIINNCLQYYYEFGKETDFFQCFADRFHSGSHNYEYSLIKSIEILINALSNTQKKKVLKSQLENVNRPLEYQILLYLAKTSACYDFNIFTNNPLDVRNTFVDFYLWLHDTIDHQSRIAADKINMLGNWIESATFGISDIESLESDLKDRIVTKRNTQKYQLFELISRLTPQYFERIEYYKTQKRYSLKTPVDDINSYYTIKRLDNIKHLPLRIDSALSASELVRMVEDSLKSSEFPKIIFNHSDAYLELFNKISLKQLKEVFEYGLTLSCDKFVHMTCALYYENIIKQFSKKFYQELVRNILNKLSNEDPEQDIKKIFIKQICESLKLLNRIGWKNQEIFKFGTEIELEQFFVSEEAISYDQNILSTIFGSVESNYYMLIIETAYACNNKTISKKCIDWLSKNISEHLSERFLAVLSYNISYLMLLDEQWTKNTVLTTINKSKFKDLFALCMCCSPKYIYEAVAVFLIENDLIEEITELIKKPKPNSENANSFINYVVIAYYYNYIDISHYRLFISCLSENNTQHLIWSCVQGINSGDYLNEKKLLEKTYDIYCETHDDGSIHSAVLKYISRFYHLDAECWNIIKTAVSTSAQNVDLWEDIRDCLEKTLEANEYIEEVIFELMKMEEIPELFIIKNIMFLLAKINMLNIVKIIARYGMENSPDVNEMSNYYHHPKEILHCADTEIYDAGWIGTKDTQTNDSGD